MLIDLRKGIDHDQLIRNQREARVRLRLAKMTLRQLREFAREHHIPLYGASSKQDILSEIMSEYGRAWKLREDEIE